jgi:hypothetical protein
MAFNETVRQYRIAYIDAAIAEMNAIANLIENDDNSKYDLLSQRCEQLGLAAQKEWLSFVEVARNYFPDSRSFETQVIETPGNEN